MPATGSKGDETLPEISFGIPSGDKSAPAPAPIPAAATAATSTAAVVEDFSQLTFGAFSEPVVVANADSLLFGAYAATPSAAAPAPDSHPIPHSQATKQSTATISNSSSSSSGTAASVVADSTSNEPQQPQDKPSASASSSTTGPDFGSPSKSSAKKSFSEVREAALTFIHIILSPPNILHSTDSEATKIKWK